MSTQFNWDFDEEQELVETVGQPTPWWRKRPLLLILPLALLIALGLGGWLYLRNQLAEEEAERRQAIQTVLDAAHDAYQAGDGSRFFATQSLDPAWQAVQLQPQNQQLYQADLTITRAEQLEDVLLVNAALETESGTLQRLLFFQWQGGRLVQIGDAPAYWGVRSRSEFEWGDLLFYEVDNEWQTETADFVTQTILDLCPLGCNANSLPFTLVLDNDYEPTATPNEIHIPSPRLIGLTPAGEPSSQFWQQLTDTLRDHLTPATLRFAIPQTRSTDFQIDQILMHLEAARQFTAENPDIAIDIVALDSTPAGDLAQRLGLVGLNIAVERIPPETADLTPYLLPFDGVAMPPTEPMLAQGIVHDLTPYVNSDPTFDQANFYEQIWQGILWRDRVWMVPRQANMRLVYYDPQAYETVGLRPPSPNWTWDELFVNLRALTANPPVTLKTEVGYADASTDTLFAYAYNWNNNCQATATVRCGRVLTDDDIAATFGWYQELASQPNYFTQLTALDPQQRLDQVRGAQVTRRTAATWVDEPSMYENYALNNPVGVLPFPGSNQFEGVTPLDVQGGIIMQTSKRPFATWQWLKFLSFHAPPSQSRYIPARPSVAATSDFWLSLPPGLGNVMRVAFPFARPIMLAERDAITWEQLLAAEPQAEELRWFLGDRD